MRFSRCAPLVLGCLAVLGCEVAAEGDRVPTKAEVADGKADFFGWCRLLGAESGCDICEEMGWYQDGACDAALMAIGTCHHADPDCGGSYCFYDHIVDAIAINEERKPRYEELTGGRSRAISGKLISSEKLARAVAVTFDLRAHRFQDQGIDVVCDEFVSMALTPEFSPYSELTPAPLSEFEKINGVALAARLTASLVDDGYAGLADTVEAELAELAPLPTYHCMVRHLLQSILRTANFTPVHVADAEALGFDSPRSISRDLVAAQIAMLPSAAGLDRDAAPIQATGVPIICQDVPPIPPGP